MPLIRLTPEAVMDASGRVANCQAQQEEIINDISRLVNDILANWEGVQKQNFQTAFEARRGTYAEFAVDLTNFANFLSSYADTLKSIDDTPREY